MRFRIYILLAAAFIWFVFASVFMYRSTWDKEDAKFYRNAVVEFGMKEKEGNFVSGIFTFRLDGLDETMGIYRRKFKNYAPITDNIHIGDTLTLYYEEWKHVKGNVNTQVIHLVNGDKILVDLADRKRKDLLIAVILYILCSISLSFAWILNQKRLRKIRSIGLEYYGLGMTVED